MENDHVGSLVLKPTATSSSTVLVLLLLVLCAPSNVCGQTLCPRDCECIGLSVECRGDNNTLARVVMDLPTIIESFTFTVFAQDPYRKVYVDLNAIGGLGKFKRLRAFQIKPFSQSAPFAYNSGLNKDIFCGWKHLEEIHLNMHSAYENSSVDSFMCLQHLQILDLSYAQMIPDATLQRLLSTKLSRHITTLLLRGIQTFGRDETTEVHFLHFFSKLNTSNLQVIDMSGNAIRTCFPGLLSLPNLKKLDISENLIFSRGDAAVWTILTSIEAALHPSMEEYSVADTGMFVPRIYGQKDSDTAYPLHWFAKWIALCYRTPKHQSEFSVSVDVQSQLCSIVQQSAGCVQNATMPRNKMALHWHSSECLFGFHIPLGPHLKLFNTSGNTKYAYPSISFLPRGRYCFHPDNAVETLDVSNMHAALYMDNPTLSNMSITGFTKLKFVNLLNNDFMLENFQIFHTMPSLEELLLGGNKVQLHMDSKNELFKHLDNLRVLDLSQNGLHILPYMEFAHLSKLERLDLSGNYLPDLNIQLPNSSMFQMLNLSNIGMNLLEESMARLFDRYSSLEVDLQGNAFICRCEALWFIHWVQTTTTRLTGHDSLDCYSEKGQFAIVKIDLKEFSKHCHPMSVLEVASISASASLCFVAIIFVMVSLYRNRSRIRYYFYRRRLTQARTVSRDDFEYDAYVSYSDNNREVRSWVNALIEELESRRGLNLFIHQRDLLGGGFYLERIDEAMRKCRKTILVLSPDFLESRTCLFEAWSAHTSIVLENQDAVVLVKLQRLPLTNVTGTLDSLMQIKECLPWEEDPAGQRMFWDQLQDNLLPITNSQINNLETASSTDELVY